MNVSRCLLAGGALAGPIYVLVYLAQAFTREGFDITRHPASVLSNGDLGWIQVASFLGTGLLVVGAGIGMRQELHPGPGSTWGPLLIAVSGAGLIAAGFFSADPVDGFPPGTPMGPPDTISATGMLHFVAALVGFIAWIAACFVFARRFAARGDTGWAWFSAITGAVFLLGFLGAMTGAVIALVVGVVLIWVWLSATSVRLMREAPAA